MSQIILTCEITSLIYMFILLFGVVIEGHGRSLITKLAAVMVSASIFCLVVDIGIAHILIHNCLPGLLNVLVGIDMNAGKLLFIAFGYYVVASINTVKKISYWNAHAIMIINIIGIIMTVFFTVRGEVYTIADGKIILGSMFSYVELSTLISILYVVAMSIVNYRAVGGHDAFAMILYLFFPLAAFITRTFNSEYDFASVAVAVATAVLYVMTQSRSLHDSYRKERSLNHTTNTDEMTGLHNRRAYDLALRGLGNNGSIGVIFCDLNGLKYANDNFGHGAGDELILKFTNILKSIFFIDDIFRTGGDEFIILYRNNSKEQFDKNLVRLRRMIAGYDPIASVGAAFGDEMDVLTLLNKAEEEMYDEKEKYYKNTERERRR